MSDQGAKKQQSSETLTLEERSQFILIEVCDEEIEAVTGGGGAVSRLLRADEKRPLVGFVTDPRGGLMRSADGLPILAVHRPLSESSLSRRASSSPNHEENINHQENIYQHILDAT